ncbi:hypothetical protein [Mycetocola saprophilus]|uniref:hypothetical protein n=1 Tax=Mycetocola saprophilus TaxID=76636 RepID=UPI0004BE49D9|nr:hypothetical protein [Mycetocola saprophilus]
MDVSTLISQLGAHPTSTARATGLSRMTIQRVRDGASSPELKTLREFALAAGLDVHLTLVPASDPGAAIAARALLDPTFTGVLDSEKDTSTGISAADVQEWTTRFERWGARTPPEIIETAGRYAAPQHRAGAGFFSPRPGFSSARMMKLAHSTGVAARGHYALSGVPVADFYLDQASTPGPLILWSENADAASEILGQTLVRADRYQPGGVLVAAAHPAYLIDSIEIPETGHRLVSPIQTVLDLHGLGFGALAEAITEGW